MTNAHNRRREDRWNWRVWAWTRRLLALIGFSVLLSATLSASMMAQLTKGEEVTLKDDMILGYVINNELAEISPPPSLSSPKLSSDETLHDVIKAIDLAAKDKRVAGLRLRLTGLSLSLPQIQELRAALLRLRADGKFVRFYSSNLGGAGEGIGPYYLASAADEVWLQPVGGVGVSSVAMQVPFLRDGLKKLGVTSDFIHQGRYKSAVESLTRMDLSAPATENMMSVLGDLNAQIRADIAKARKFDDATMVKLSQDGFYDADQALAAKLVDRIAYLDEFAQGDDAKNPEADKPAISLLAYSDLREEEVADETEEDEDAKKIALVYGVGEITEGDAQDEARGELTAASMVKTLREATEDEEVAAIVLRLDTPGGSPAASESIRRAIIRAQSQGKKVVVSMSGVAASGGYWIASAADKIIAQPATITGSIGVFGGKFVASETFKKLGVNIQTLKQDASADVWSATRPFSDAERARISAQMKTVYDQFVTRVAEGRKMPVEKAQSLAEGRIYTGAQALEVGLVDGLGGLEVAKATAENLLGLTAGSQLAMVEFPARKNPIERLFDLITGGVAMAPLDLSVLIENHIPQAGSRLEAPVVTVY